jgi:hypothetical protein
VIISGPAFKKNNISTLIWCCDHNFNVVLNPQEQDSGLPFPIIILSDPKAAKYVVSLLV